MIKLLVRYFRNHIFISKEYRYFLRRNRRFWAAGSIKSTGFNGKYVLVDLTVGNLGYLLGNLIVAKYLQINLGYRLIGLLPVFYMRKLKLLGRSYGIRQFVAQPMFLNPIVKRRYLKEAQSLKTVKDPNDLISWERKGLQIGDLVYDDYIRVTGHSTVAEINDEIRYHIARTCMFQDWFNKLYTNKPIAATVQGHIIYSNFGTMARVGVQRGLKIYATKPAAGPITIRRYDTIEMCKTSEFTFSVSEVAEFAKHLGKAADEKIDEYLSQRFDANMGISAADVHTAFGRDKTKYSREELFDALDLSLNKPTGCIMTHVLCDSPHNGCWMLYKDYHEWLVSTLEIIKNIEDVNWIIKPHPSDKYYNPSPSIEKILEDYVSNYPHIRCAPPDLHAASLHSVVDAIVTVRGTAGLEFAAIGVPPIIAGKGPYSGHGFTIEPKTVEKYKTTLTNVGKLKPLSQEAQSKARIFTYLHFVVSRIQSTLVPDIPAEFWTPVDTNMIWLDAAKRLENNSVEDDPLFTQFSLQIEADNPHLLNHDLLSANLS